MANNGHRVFGVKNIETQEIVARFLEEKGLSIVNRFTSGPSTQIVFNDGTVLNVLDRGMVPTLPGSAISILVDDPIASATELVSRLRILGHEANCFEPIKDLPPNSFAMVFCAALEGWMMGFRSPIIDEVERQLSKT